MSLEDFSEATRANIEVALTRACTLLPDDKAMTHKARSYVAQHILAAAHQGDRTLTKLTEAGRQAVIQLKSAH